MWIALWILSALLLTSIIHIRLTILHLEVWVRVNVAILNIIDRRLMRWFLLHRGIYLDLIQILNCMIWHLILHTFLALILKILVLVMTILFIVQIILRLRSTKLVRIVNRNFWW